MSDPLAAVKHLFASVSADGVGDGPTMTVSTIAADREGDRVLPEGGQFENFLKNPILMWAHGYGSLPIGTVTGIDVQPGAGVRASWRWLENDEFAGRVKNAWDQGVIRAASLGFRPLKTMPNDRGMDIEQWELLEISLVPIPMHPEAVRTLKGLLDAPTVPDARLDQLDAIADVLQKRGRVLSAVNESRLRAAVQALSDAAGVLGDVLGQLNRAGHDEDHPEDEDHEPKPMHEPMMGHGLSAESSVLRITFAEDSPDEEGSPIFTLRDEDNREPTFAVDPALIQAAIRGAMSEALRTSVGEYVSSALDAARGRIQ